jgi:peptide/nickel transport system permease protein
MVKYIARRLLFSIPLLLVISVVLFILTNSLGDPLATFAETRQRPTAQQREEILRRLGLDKPILEQYIYWLVGNDWTLVDVRGDGEVYEPGRRRGVLRGDLGISTVTRQPAWTRIEERLPNTLTLAVPAYVITVVLAVLIGTFSAVRQYSFFDNLITGLSFFFFSMPIFFIGLMLIYIFGLQFERWGWQGLPIGGMYTPGTGRQFGDLLMHMIMPVTCLIAIQLAGYVRFVRSSMVEVMAQDYIRTARSKGLGEGGIVRKHALKNASLPLVTLIGLDLPFLLAGAVVTESLFAWPGMGQLFIQSFERADVPVIMAILMLVSVMVVIFQLITDVVYTWFDPRIRYN